MLGPNTSLNKSPVHGMVHKAHRLQKRTTETEPLSSNGIRKAALSDGRHSSKERPGETAHCQGSPSSHIPFLVHQQNRAFVIFVFLNGSSVRLNYWSHVYHCHAGKLIQVASYAYVCFILSNFEQRFSSFKGWHCMTRSLGLALPFFLPSSVPTSILRFFTLPNIPKENAGGGKN